MEPGAFDGGERREGPSETPGWGAHLLVALTVVLLVAPVLVAFYRHHLAGERALVAQVAALKASWLETWFDERRASAGLSGTSFPQAELYLAWQRDGDPVALDRLLRRLRDFADAGGFSDVSLLDPAGHVLWAEDEHAGALGELYAAATPDGAPGDAVRVRTYRDGQGVTHVDFVVALPVTDGGAPPRVVYHSSPADLLRPQLGDWVTPTRTGRVVLVRLLDDAVHVFRRDGADGDMVVTEAIVHAERQDVLAVRLAHGVAADGARVVEGRDPLGVRVIAAGREAGDTGWIVVARIDRGEVLGGIVPLLVATVLAAVVVYAASMIVLGRVRRKQRAAVALGAQRAEAERERAMRLLSAVADASPDAIYTKDHQGRYTLVNRAAAEFLGPPAAEVLGRTDRELFPAADADLIEANDRVAADEARVVTLEEPVVTAAGRRVFLATKGPLVDGQGREVGTFGISRDITERRAAEQAVVEQAATLRTALADLERFNRVLVDRELTMVGLKRRLNAYAARLGEAPPFPGASAGDDGDGDA